MLTAQTLSEQAGETVTPLARWEMKHESMPVTKVELTVHIDKVHTICMPIN